MTARSVKNPSISTNHDLDLFTRILHLGMAFLGILALATGEAAEGFKQGASFGFFIHSWLGMSASFFIGTRFIYGLIGPTQIRFKNWVPYTKERLQIVGEDILGLLQFKLPDRQHHEGLAALVETAGLILFFITASTGAVLFFTITPGSKPHGIISLIKEVHEVGEILPLFLLIHGGAVLLHALSGKHHWRKMVFLKEK